MKLASLLAIVASLAGVPRVAAAPAVPDREVRAGFDRFVAAPASPAAAPQAR